MRKEKRALRDKEQLENLLRRCHIVHLALWDGEEPYAVTVNFGYDAGAIYFHSALEGRKIDCIRANALVSFIAVVESELIREELPCGYTTHYTSVSGFGLAAILEDAADKAAGLAVIMRHHGGPDTDFDARVLERTAVVRVTLRDMIGKVNPTPHSAPSE